MSINKFIIYFVKNKPFFLIFRIERPGFWIFELLVSVVILMVINLILIRFSCNMVQLEADSINRLRAIDHIASYLDGDLTKKPNISQNGVNFEDLSSKLELKSNISEICIAKSNLPEYVKNWQKSSNFKVLTVTVSFKSASGKENIVKILASAPIEG